MKINIKEQLEKLEIKEKLRNVKKQLKNNPKTTAFCVIVFAAMIATIVVLSNRPRTDKIIATIKHDVILESDLAWKIKTLTGNDKVDISKLSPEIKEAVIKEIAAEKLLVQEARREGITRDKVVQKNISRATSEIVKVAFINKMYEKEVSEEAVKKHYDQLVVTLKGKTEYQVSHILVSTQKEAQNLKDTISNNRNIFAKIAQNLSKDKASAKNGGSLGYVVTGQLNPEFERAFIALPKGIVSEPVQTKLGWHLILVENKRLAKPAEYNQVKNAIKQNLANKILREYVTNLLKDGKLEIIPAAEVK